MNTAEEIYSNVSKRLQRENLSASELWERVRPELLRKDGLNQALTIIDTIYELYQTKCQTIIKNLNEE